MRFYQPYTFYPIFIRRFLVHRLLFAIDDLFESRLLASMQHNPVSPLKLEFS